MSKKVVTKKSAAEKQKFEFPTIKPKNKVSVENSLVAVQKMADILDPPVLNPRDVETLSGLVCRQKLFINEGAVMFRLAEPITDGSGTKKTDFAIRQPSKKQLDDNEIGIMEYARDLSAGDINQAQSDILCQLMIGLDDDTAGQIPMGDLNEMFLVFMIFFIGR